MKKTDSDHFAPAIPENGGQEVTGFVFGESRYDELILVWHVSFDARVEFSRGIVGKNWVVALRDLERRLVIGCELQPITIDFSVFVELEAAAIEVGMKVV